GWSDMLPTAHAEGFSGYARPNGPRWRLTGLPGPTDILSRVLITVHDQPTGRTDMGTYRQALGDPMRTAAEHSTAVLAGIRWRDCNHLTPGAYCLGLQDGAKRCPARIADALGEVVIPHHIRNPHIFKIDHVVLAQQGERGLVMEVATLAL